MRNDASTVNVNIHRGTGVNEIAMEIRQRERAEARRYRGTGDEANLTIGAEYLRAA